jgi:hypothetical protein
VPLTGLLSLLDLVVVAEIEPLQTSILTTDLKIVDDVELNLLFMCSARKEPGASAANSGAVIKTRFSLNLPIPHRS